MTVAGRRIELWVEARGGVAAVNPIMRALLDDLAGEGALVSVRVPEHELVDPNRLLEESPPDLVLLKTATTLALSVAVADEAWGVRFLNGAQATLRAHDKAATIARLAAAGLPVPATYLAAAYPGGAAPPDADGAWVTKPTRGIHGRGVSLHPEFPLGRPAAAEGDANGSYVVDDGTRLVQRKIGGDQPDLKVYVAAGRCFAGAKPFGPHSYARDAIESVDLDPALAELSRAVGEALELRCFGVDLRFDGDRPFIIDANPFPGYRGFAGAVPALRAEIARVLEPANR